jgi:hypothetical protein
MHKDLLDQAVSLATLDARKPKQANVRRAISSTYYDLFHLLVKSRPFGQVSPLRIGWKNPRRRAQ